LASPHSNSIEAGGLRLQAFTPADAECWDALVARSVNGTFLHTRRFLSYHGERFADRSCMLFRADRLCAVFPAALDRTDSATVVSHPGITYGGMVHDGSMSGAEAVTAMDALAAHYGRGGAQRLLYKTVPHIYQQRPAEDDAYALFRLGAKLVRRDLSCSIDLAGAREPSERRRRGLRRAQREGVAVVAGNACLPAFWQILSETLKARHASAPVHSLGEIELLAGRFPDHIELLAATVGDRLIAGSVLFKTPRVSHVQYTAASDEGRRVCATDLITEVAIERAAAEQRRYFDFGISTEQGGRVLNEGLHQFKAEFGGGGVSYDFYLLELG
jgi:hypothetical protein